MTGVILGCDPGHDDAMALLLALASPQLELLGVTTTANAREWVGSLPDRLLWVLPAENGMRLNLHSGDEMRDIRTPAARWSFGLPSFARLAQNADAQSE